MRAPLGLEIRAAATALEAMRQGEALPSALLKARQPLPKESWSAVQDMAYQAVRQLGLCLSLAEILNNKPPPPLVLAVQVVTLTQLLDARRAPAIVLDQVVEACKSDDMLKFSAGFINAVMRRFLREQQALMAQVSRIDMARYNLPDWWLALLRRDHPQHWEQIVEDSHRKASMSLRVNQRKTTLAAYSTMLSDAAMGHDLMGQAEPDAKGHHLTPAIRLHEAVDVHALPGWGEGLVSVQDLGAQLVAPLLQVAPKMRVLDACAAPGGKTAHILESVDCEMVALEFDEQRASRIDENLRRLDLMGPKLHFVLGDATRPRTWWDGKPFDRILVDAPCSASGIVARHPDIPWLRRRSDIATLSGQQLKIVQSLWPLLRPGGKLLLSTCSVFRDEGEYLLASLLRDLKGAQAEPLTWQFGATAPVKLGHLLPARLPNREHDGFFYARLTKAGGDAGWAKT